MGQQPTLDSRERMVRLGIGAWTTIGVAIVVAGVLWSLSLISSALTPFVMAGILVLLLRQPVRRLERRGVPRALAVVIWYLIGTAVLTVFSAFVVPALGGQIGEFLEDFPGYYERAQTFWLQLQNQFSGMVIPAWAHQALDDLSSTVTAQFGAWSRALASGVVSAGGAAASFLFNIVFSLVIAFWVLRDMPLMRAELLNLVGEPRREEAEMIWSTVLRVLGGYIRGQFLVSLVTGTLIAIFLAIIGVPYALVLGLIGGILNVIPYVGALLGGLIAAVAAVTVGPWTPVLAILATVAAQQITDLFVTPRVMSEQVDLHPLLVIFSLLVGGTLFGFVGLLVAIPVAAIIKGLFVYYYEKHTKRPLGSEQGVLFRKKPEPAACTVELAQELANESSDLPAEERD